MGTTAENSPKTGVKAKLSILQAMLIHGMVVQGTPSGDHYGPVAISEPDERAEKQSRALGRRVAELAAALAAAD